MTALKSTNLVNDNLNTIKENSKSASVFFDMQFYVIDYKKAVLLSLPLLTKAFIGFWGLIMTAKYPEAAKTVLWFAENGKSLPLNVELVGNPFNPPKDWKELKENTMTVIQVRILQADGKWKSLGSYHAFHWWEIDKAVDFYTTTIIGLYQHYVDNNLHILKIGFSYKHLTMEDAILKFRAFKQEATDNIKPYISDMNKFYNHIPHIWNLEEWKKIPGIAMRHINHVDGIYYMSNVPIFWVSRKEEINNEVDKSLPDSTVNIEFMYEKKAKIRHATVFDKSGIVLTRFRDEVVNEMVGKPAFDFDLQNQNVEIKNQIQVIEFKRIFADGTELYIIDNMIERANARKQADLFIKEVKPSQDVLSDIPHTILGTYDIETRAYFIPKEYETVSSLAAMPTKEIIASETLVYHDENKFIENGTGTAEVKTSETLVYNDENQPKFIGTAEVKTSETLVYNDENIINGKAEAKASETLVYNDENHNNDTENSQFVCDQFGKPIEHLQVICISVLYRNINTLKNGFNSEDDYKLFTYRIDDYVDKNAVMTNNPLDYIGAEKAMIQKFFADMKQYAAHQNKPVQLFAHNGAQFDLVFLLNHLVKFENKVQRLNFLVRDSKFISTTWSINRMKFVEVGNGYREEKVMKKDKNGVLQPVMTSITIKDSYLLLPTALAKAAKQFGVPDKGEFDFNKINNAPFDVLRKHMAELLEYNVNDSKVLWHVLANYNKYLVEHFKVSIFDCPTAASIAFRVFRLNYLKQQKEARYEENHNLPITSFEMYNVLKEAYLGGACDVYKPTNPEGSTVYTYDINSEYPSMMASQLMPTGIYKHVISNKLDLTDPSLVGFVKCNVYCPHDMLVPLLARKIKGKMVAGAGNWTGIYFSAEIREAISRGYQIEPIEAWLFEGKLVFNEFINDLYKMRLSYPKSDPMNFICKQIMNSTYGRFGMAPYLKQVKVLTRDMDHNFQDFSEFTEIHQVDEDKVIVASKVKANELVDENQPGIVNISLPIAAAITSYGRICIHRIKWEAALSGSLMYSDTDSVMTSTPISDELIGDALGQLKLEYTAEKGIFISPKVYALSGVKDAKGNDMKNIVKAKGLGKDIIHFEDYYEILNKNNAYKTFQRKWFRDIFTGSIKIMNLQNMVRINEGKRLILLDNNDNFVDTANIIFKDNEIISPLVINIHNDIVLYFDPEIRDQELSYPPIIDPIMDGYKPPLIDLPQVIQLHEKLYIDIYTMVRRLMIKLDNELLNSDLQFRNELVLLLDLNNKDIDEIHNLMNHIQNKYKPRKFYNIIKFLSSYIDDRISKQNNEALMNEFKAKENEAREKFNIIIEDNTAKLEIIQNKLIQFDQDRINKENEIKIIKDKADKEVAKAKEIADTRAQAQAKLIIDNFIKQADAKLEANAKALAADLLAKAEAEKAEAIAKAEAEKAEAIAKAEAEKAKAEAEKAKAEALEVRLAALEAALLKGVKAEETKVEDTKVSESIVDETIDAVASETKVDETIVDSLASPSSDADISDGNISPDEVTEEINDISDEDINNFSNEMVDQSEPEFIDYGDDEDDEGGDGDSSPPSSPPSSDGDSTPPVGESPPSGAAPSPPPSPPSVDVIIHKEGFVNIKDRNIEELITLGLKKVEEEEDEDNLLSTDYSPAQLEIIETLHLNDQSTIDLNTMKERLHEVDDKLTDLITSDKPEGYKLEQFTYQNAKRWQRSKAIMEIITCIFLILKARDQNLARAELGFKGSIPKSKFITVEPTEIVSTEILRDEIVKEEISKDVTVYDDNSSEIKSDSYENEIIEDKLQKLYDHLLNNPTVLLNKEQKNFVLDLRSKLDNPTGRQSRVFMEDITQGGLSEVEYSTNINFINITNYSEKDLRMLGKIIKDSEEGYIVVGNKITIAVQSLPDLKSVVKRITDYIEVINSKPKLGKVPKLDIEYLSLLKELILDEIYTREDAGKQTTYGTLIDDIISLNTDREFIIKRTESILKPTQRAQALIETQDKVDKGELYLNLPRTEMSRFEEYGYSLYINDSDPVEYMEIKSLFDFEKQTTEDIIDTIDRIEKYIKDIPKLKGLNKNQRISKRESLTLILNLFKDEINRRGGDGGPQGGSPIAPITSDNTPEKSENIIKEVKIPELRSSKPNSRSKPNAKANAKADANTIITPSIISIDNIDKITNKDIRNMLKSIDFNAKVNEIQDQIVNFFNLENCKLQQVDDLRDVIQYLITRGLDDQEKLNLKMFKQFALTHIAKIRIKLVNENTKRFKDGTILCDLPDSELLLLEKVITPFNLNGDYERCRKLLRLNDEVEAHLLDIYYRLKNTNICPIMQKTIASYLFHIGAFKPKPGKGKFDP